VFSEVNDDRIVSLHPNPKAKGAIRSLILMPISVPSLITLSILTFTDSWNNLQWAYFAGGQGRIEAATTLPVALLSFRAQQQTGVPDWTGMMAGTLISALPILIVFVIFGRRMIDSIQFTGFK
jgi:multiple sugar transport system permease protein